MMNNDNKKVSRKRRVMILEPTGNLWGSERVLLEFLAVFPFSSWQAGVYYPGDSPIARELARFPIVRFPRFERNLHLKGRGRRMRAVVRFLAACWKFRPDLLYVNQIGGTPYALFVGRLLRIPVVTHVQWHEDPQNVISWRANPRSLPKIVCVSHYLRGLFPPGHIVLAEQLVSVYDPYIPRCDWNAPVGATIPDSEATVICVARLDRHKGQDVLLEALGALRREGRPVKALFLGEARSGDDFGAQLQELTTHLGLEDDVTWGGTQAKVLPFIAKCVALVLPSHLEAFGRVVLEAWDAGTIPIVWQGSGGPAESVRRSGGGLLYEKQDGASLAGALKQVLAMTGEEREAMIQQGRNWMLENCDSGIYTRTITTLWEEAVAARQESGTA